MVYGRSAGGEEVGFPQTPSLVEQAQKLAAARACNQTINRAVVTPEGLGLYFRNRQMMTELPATAAPQYRRVYGFVGGFAEESKSRWPDLGLLFTIVLKIPFFFSDSTSSCESSGEFHFSHVWVRVLAFSTLFCGDQQNTPFRAGEPVCGVLESVTPEKGEKHPIAMLVGWDFTTCQECPHIRALDSIVLSTAPNDTRSKKWL